MIVEDDLKVTSDLGLSIDSLHLSEEDNVLETTPSDKVHSSQNGVDHLDTNAFGNGIESGVSEPYDGSISAKTLVIPSGDKLMEYELDTISESGSTTKRVRRKKGGGGCRRGTNGSSSTQPAVAASSSSTSLKAGKTTARNSHKTAKKSIKRHTKK